MSNVVIIQGGKEVASYTHEHFADLGVISIGNLPLAHMNLQLANGGREIIITHLLDREHGAAYLHADRVSSHQIPEGSEAEVVVAEIPYGHRGHRIASTGYFVKHMTEPEENSPNPTPGVE